MLTKSLEQRIAGLEARLQQLVKENRYFYGSWPGLSREASSIEREIDQCLSRLEAYA